MATPSATAARRRWRRIDVDLVAAVVATVVVAAALVAVVAGSSLDDGATADPDVGAAAESVTPADEPAGSFTVGQLHAGEVTPARFAAFWEAQLEQVATRPCPAVAPPAGGGGTTVVTAFVGATPPDHLGDAYRDYAPLLSDAHAAAAARCTA